MASKFYTGIDLCNQELLRARLQNLAAAPTTGVAAGMIFYDNSTSSNTKGRAVLRSASAWEALAFAKDLNGYTTTGTHNNLVTTVGGINTRLQEVEKIFETDSDGIINKWNEVLAFLADVEGDNLDSMLGSFALKSTSFNAGTGLTGTLKLDGTGTFGLAAVGIQGTYCKVTTDAYGRVTSGDSLVEDDIPSLPISKITNLATSISDFETGIANINALFNNGAAKKAVADAAGNNIASTYATQAALEATNKSTASNASAISSLQSLFTNGKANNADKLDGNDSDYFATASALAVLDKTVVNISGSLVNLTSRVDVAESSITTLLNWYNKVGIHFGYNSTKDSFFLEGNFYTTGENAAGGLGSEYEGGGSGGGIVDYDSIVSALGYVPVNPTVLNSYLTSATAASTYATVGSVNALASRVDTLESESTSVSYEASSASSAVIGTITIDNQAKEIKLLSANVTAALGFTPTRKFTGSVVANGNLTQYFTHNFNTRDVIVQIFEPSSPYEQIYTDVKVTSTNQVAVTFAEKPAMAYKVVIIG